LDSNTGARHRITIQKQIEKRKGKFVVLLRFLLTLSVDLAGAATGVIVVSETYLSSAWAWRRRGAMVTSS
jgi:hypothetical protein